MILVCTQAFGNFKPGDEIQVPDGAVFDTAHFEQAEPEKTPAPSKGEKK